MRGDHMKYTIDIRRASDAPVWIATSEEIPGLVVESDTFDNLVEEVKLIVPDLLEPNGLAYASTVYFNPQGFQHSYGNV